MLEGPPQSNRTPTIAKRATFGILKSCRNRGSLFFLQSTGLWFHCGKSTILLQFRPIEFDCVEIAPNKRRCEAILQNCKPNLPNWDRLQTAIPSITVGLYETFNPSTILADSKGFWRIPRDYGGFQGILADSKDLQLNCGKFGILLRLGQIAFNPNILPPHATDTCKVDTTMFN